MKKYICVENNRWMDHKWTSRNVGTGTKYLSLQVLCIEKEGVAESLPSCYADNNIAFHFFNIGFL